jgi:hypothetical protein
VLGDPGLQIDTRNFTLRRRGKQTFDEHEMLMGTAKISDYQETNAKIPIVESKSVKFQQMSASLPKKKMVWA